MTKHLNEIIFWYRKVAEKFSLEMCSDEAFLKHALGENIQIQAWSEK